MADGIKSLFDSFLGGGGISIAFLLFLILILLVIGFSFFN